MNTAKLRLLAIAIKARWLGFAVLEDGGLLFEWGMIYYSKKPALQLRTAKGRLQTMIQRVSPSHVVLLQRESAPNLEIASIRALTRIVREIAAREGIPLAVLSRKTVRSMFHPEGAHSRSEIALAVVRNYPELGWKLPPERKLWMAEDPRMTLFDAVSAAIAHERLQGFQSDLIAPSGRPPGDV
jgi:hypothetical protein